MSNKVLYSLQRFTRVDDILYNTIRGELRAKLDGVIKQLNDKMDAEERYIDQDGYQILDPKCEPYRELTYSVLLEENGATIGFILLRASSNLPKHHRVNMATRMERVFELRFKTYSGVIPAVAGSGIACVKYPTGPYMFNGNSVSFMSLQILKKHWDQYKDQAVFDLDKPQSTVRMSVADIVWARGA